MLEDVNQLRDRVRRERRQHPLSAALIGAVAAVGAVTFFFTQQIETRSCEETEFVMSCVGGIRGFDEGWVWLVAGLVAIAVPFVRRYRHGTWRPSTGAWIAMAIVALVIVPSVLPLMSVLAPIVYPVLAAVAIVGVAVRRRDVLASVTGVVLAATTLYVDLRVDPASLLEHNLGLTLFSVAVSLLAFGLAALWAREDRRA